MEDYFSQRVEEINSLIGSYVAQDATAFYEYEEYEQVLTELIQFTHDRRESVMAQLEGSQPSETYGTIETNVNLIAMGTQIGGRGENNRTPDLAPTMSQKGQAGHSIEMPGRTNNMKGIIEVIISFVALIVGLLFVIRYKRKKTYS